MITTVKVILIFMMVLSLMGTIAEKDNEKQFNLMLITIVNVVAVVVLVLMT